MEAQCTSQESNTDQRKSRLGNCEVCATKLAKFTCPRCEVKTCSLGCSRTHKEELKCDGIVPKVVYRSLDTFTDLDVVKDYRYLEESLAVLQKCKKLNNKYNKHERTLLPPRLYRLKKALEEHRTTLKFMAPVFLRHRINKTRLHFATNTVFWHIEWRFLHSENLTLVDERVKETRKLSSILEKYFSKVEDEVLQKKLEYYHALGLTGIKVLLLAAEKRVNKYYELDLDETIQENFSRKVIIEFPTILIVNKDHADSFDVIDSDMEDDSSEANLKPVCGAEVISRILRRHENGDPQHSFGNFLFLKDGDDEVEDDE